jgi:hypothetical protein
MDENGELQMDNKIKAELLNKFFQSVFTIEDTTQGISIFPPRTDQAIHFYTPVKIRAYYGIPLFVRPSTPRTITSLTCCRIIATAPKYHMHNG